jgi:hypothetical protein
MALTVTHAYQSTIAEDGTSGTPGGLVGPDEWNAIHEVVGVPDLTINTQTANYTLQLADAGSIVEMNVASANTVTIPNNSSVPFTVGTSIFLTQVGVGSTSVVAAAGVTIDGQATLGQQWAEATLYKRGTNEWVIGVSVSNINSNALLNNVADQTMSGGVNINSASLVAGNITVDCGKCPLQFIANNGAFTITAPANDGSCMILMTNGGSAGAVTWSGFTVGANTGDALDTTSGHKFTLSIWRINGISGYRIAAHQ